MLRRSGFRRPSYDEVIAKAKERQARAKERGKKPARLKAGRKVREWDKVRAELKEECERLGIRSCEIRLPKCTGALYTGFAHSKKRRNIVGDELREACLACSNCHAIIEAKPEKEMSAIVRAVLAERGTRDEEYSNHKGVDGE